MKELITAVNSVMKEVKGMEKNSRVGGNSKNAYNGTKDQDVKEVFNDALSKHGLAMIPFDIEESTQVDRWEGVDPWSKSTPKDTKMFQSVFTKVVVKYNLYHVSGQSIVVCGYGHGVDPQDKGAGKATTYAMKNALLYTFLTPVGKIDDTETTHSNEIQTPQAKAKQVLTANHPKYNECIKYLKGAGSMTKLKEGYEISKDVEEKLMAIVLA
jgi:hypothetical protein